MPHHFLFNIENPDNETQTWFDERGFAWRLSKHDSRVREYVASLIFNRVIGEPQSPEGSPYTVEDLKKFGLVGVYEL